MNNNYGNNYNSSARNNSYTSYSGVPRNWLIFAQIFGTIFSVIGLIIFISYMQKINNSLPGDNLTNKSVVALILAIIVYFVWRSIYTATVIVKLAKHSSDEELCANRYIISALSLGVGGFFTPFLITQFPNVETSSTIKPRYFLSKTMGLCLLIGAPLLALSYFLTLFTGPNAITNGKLIFAGHSTITIISSVILAISIAAVIFGLLSTKLFFSNKTMNDFANDNPSKLSKLISTIWMTILTIELLIVILFSIVRLLSALLDVFRSQEEGGGMIMMLFALMRLFITISYVGMVIYITTQTMMGLWSIDGNVKIKRYQHNKFTENHLNSNNAFAR